MEHRRLQMQPEHTPVTVLEEDSDSDEIKEELKTEDEGENSDNENDVDKEDISSGDERRTTRSRTTASQLPPKNGQTSTASEDEDEEPEGEASPEDIIEIVDSDEEELAEAHRRLKAGGPIDLTDL
ncbi:hypothetical protein B0H10DRAFT_1963525 [Mycena sp. CBHHK59/15]|nr:hypothetical protein B0H10DRAFT_1963525 [Mycena sp. CBHHK59/15]